jgi:hypothetical protein
VSHLQSVQALRLDAAQAGGTFGSGCVASAHQRRHAAHHSRRPGRGRRGSGSRSRLHRDAGRAEPALHRAAERRRRTGPCRRRREWTRARRAPPRRSGGQHRRRDREDPRAPERLRRATRHRLRREDGPRARRVCGRRSGELARRGRSGGAPPDPRRRSARCRRSAGRARGQPFQVRPGLVHRCDGQDLFALLTPLRHARPADERGSARGTRGGVARRRGAGRRRVHAAPVRPRRDDRPEADDGTHRRAAPDISRCRATETGS